MFDSREHFHKINCYDGYFTRGGDNFMIPSLGLSLTKMNPYYIGIKLFNHLPRAVIRFKEITKIERWVTAHIFNKAYRYIIV